MTQRRRHLALAVACAVLALAPAARSADDPPKPTDYCRRQLGSWFYCAQPEPQKIPEASTRAPAPAQPAEIAELEAFQRQIEDARKVAVWSPTPANIERYYRLQQVALNKGGLFADEWRRLIWTNPDLDYTLERPVSEIGKHDWEDARTADRDLFLRGVSAQVGLFFVFKGSCGACRTASPLIRAFSNRYGLSVKAISTDGSANPDFADVVPDRGQLAAWGVDRATTPALLIYQSPNPIDRQGQTIPVVVSGSDGKPMTLRPCGLAGGCLTYLGAGIMPVEDIAERLFVLLAKEPGTDF